jgi:hypothetical protein
MAGNGGTGAGGATASPSADGASTGAAVATASSMIQGEHIRRIGMVPALLRHFGRRAEV